MSDGKAITPHQARALSRSDRQRVDHFVDLANEDLRRGRRDVSFSCLPPSVVESFVQRFESAGWFVTVSSWSGRGESGVTFTFREVKR